MRLRRASFQAVHSLLVLLLIFATHSAFAAIIKVPADQPTIQAGINAAAPGDTVLVSPGTYYENIDFTGKAITVTSSAGAATTIVDGSGKAPVATFDSGETRASILSNLTIRNGGATPGTVGIATWGGIFTGLDSNPSILNNLIVQNACNGYFGSGGALLQGNTISGTLPPSTAGCSYGEGAAVFLKGNSTTLPVVQVIGNIIENNVHPTAAIPGAITINGYIGAIIESNIVRNNAMTGIYVVNTNSLVIAQNLVYGNVSTNQAGGLYALIPFTTFGPPIGTPTPPSPPNTTSPSPSISPASAPLPTRSPWNAEPFPPGPPAPSARTPSNSPPPETPPPTSPSTPPQSRATSPPAAPAPTSPSPLPSPPESSASSSPAAVDSPSARPSSYSPRWPQPSP